MEEALAPALADAGPERFRLADDLARLFVTHAFLGQLDVNPLGDHPGGGQGRLNQCEFWARRGDAAADEAGDDEASEGRPREVPAEAGRQLMGTLGPAFVVFRDRVWEELRLSDEQKKKLEKRLQDTERDTTQFFQKLADKGPEAREK